MRAELPWNVAGIPPEAREAARAAARREGLSVGEWLTRRILRSFSGMEEELAHMPFENRAPAGAALDSWGLPQSAASRRDTEEMMARVGRSESESNDAWRRIEDQLRGLARRLDSSERNHGESNRVLSRTAQEMNIAAREQAQAFDQLGMSVIALNERLERLERTAAHDGIKDAVKALHQGLSRLADQITATANNSASQVVTLTTNLEQLAGRVGQARVESEEANRALEARIDDTAYAVGTRLETIDRSLDTRLSTVDTRFSSVDTRLSSVESTADARFSGMDTRLSSVESNVDARFSGMDTRLSSIESNVDARFSSVDTGLSSIESNVDARFSNVDARLSSVENTARFSANALDHALEKIEASVNNRVNDQVENQKRGAQHEEALARLEDSIARLEVRMPDAEFERRLDGIEHSVSGMADRMEEYGPNEKLDASLQVLSHRLDAMEKDYNDLLAELRTNVLHPVEPPPHEAPFHEAPGAQAMAQPAAEAFAPPPYAEPPFVRDTAPAAAPLFSYAGEEADAFAEPATPHGYSFDIPPETSDPFVPPPEFEDVFVDTQEPENFLAQARRSARAASEKSESERLGRLGAFRWGKDAAPESEQKAKSRYLLPALVAMLVVVAAAAALVLSQRAKHSDVAVTPVTRPATVKGPAYSVPTPPDSDDTQFVVAPQAGHGDEKNFDTQRSEPDSQDNPPRTPAPLKQHEVRNAPVNPVPEAAKPNSAAPSADKVIQLANSGNPVALTILGLRDLDGPNGTAVNLPDAVKFLSEAAEKGQAVAQYRLGTLYERGQGVAADPVKAAHWYEMAANQGNRKAMHNLAVSYASGAAGKKNMAEAARWFAKAAALGLSDSQFNLAVLYERGDGVPQSLLDAFKWYSIAANTGDSESKQRMSVLQTQLSDADKAAANKSAVTFHAAPLNRSANVPPEAADLGT
jgi:localization factor PodJL